MRSTSVAQFNVTRRRMFETSCRELCRSAYRFVFPPACPLCHGEVAATSCEVDGRLVTPVLCDRCSAEAIPPPGNRCQKCGVSIGQFIRSEKGCSTCRNLSYRFDCVIRLGLYDGLLREACIRGKSSHTQPISAALANLLWLNERVTLEAVKPDLVVPVPRYWTRRLTQSHHQAETISRVLSQRLQVPHARTLLHKTRLTPDQSELTAAQRRLNLRGAFSVWFGQRQVIGKTILLVDDILTTGTTVNECTKTLLNAGAKRVVVAAIAVVPPYRH